MINPPLLSQTTRKSLNWADARQRVIQSYRLWLRAAPQIQTEYTLNMPVSNIRNRIRLEFERNRPVSQLSTVDVLLMKSNQEYQETLNFWKQVPQVMKYFDGHDNVRAEPPTSFLDGFLQGRN